MATDPFSITWAILLEILCNFLHLALDREDCIQNIEGNEV